MSRFRGNTDAVAALVQRRPGAHRTTAFKQLERTAASGRPKRNERPQAQPEKGLSMYAVAKTRRAMHGPGKSLRRRRLAPRGRKPRRQIAHVYLNVCESTGLALYAITLRLC